MKRTHDRKARILAVAIRPGLPVILCSGFSERTQHLSARDGVARVLDKPVSAKERAQALRETLDGAVAAASA